jgi:broad specificity phosphatase PhoE
MKIILIRHLVTPWNQQRKIQGSIDISLLPPDETALAKIQENQQILACQNPDLVITSSLKRTQETAQLYGYNDFIIESLINELNFGEFEGQNFQLFQDRLENEWLTNPQVLILGETLIDFENRIKAFLNLYQSYSQLLIFSHGVWTRGLLSLIKYGTVNQLNTPEFRLTHNQLIMTEINPY